MLFQPTNITPDVLNGEGNGVVDTTDGMSVTWQVNGNSAMTAYQIKIYNDMSSSTPVVNTGVINLVEPFYGKDQYGNVQLFKAIISSSAVSSLVDGNTYYLVITQNYRESGSTRSVVQKSPSVFMVQATPSIAINVPSLIDTCEYTFTATCTVGSSTAILNWTRWQIYDEDDSTNSIYDTGRIYGAAFECHYDGFLNNHSYTVTATAQTSDGQTVTESSTFSTEWSISSIVGTSHAVQLNSQSSAVKVYWDGFRYINGTPHGDYSIADGVLSLPTSSFVEWDEVNGDPMSLDAPWSMVYRTILQSADMMLYLSQSGQSAVTINYDYAERTLSMLYGSTAVATFPNVNGEDVITVILTPLKIYVRRYGHINGLTPSENLTPSNILVPSDGEMGVTLEIARDVTYTQGNITSVMVYGKQVCDYVQIIAGTISDEDITAAYTDGTYVPAQEDGSTPVNPNTTFLADFVNGLDAGTLTIGGADITGWAIYRKQESEPITRHLANVSLSTSAINDFGCGNGQGNYTYYIYPISSDQTYITAAYESNEINPVSWNWSIVEATLQEDNVIDVYDVVNEYVFRNNVSSSELSNNNSPGILQNFTRYPTVQMSHSNYLSGTLTTLIGQIGYVSYMVQAGDTIANIAERFGVAQAEILQTNEINDASLSVGTIIRIFLPNGLLQYMDDIKMREAIFALSTTSNSLFLKDRKGDIWEIRTSAPISAGTQDNTAEQATTMSVPWIQVGDATVASLIGKAKH